MFVKISGAYINKKEVKDGDTAVLLDSGTIETSEGKFGKKNNVIFRTNYKGEERKLRFTKTSLVACGEAWGVIAPNGQLDTSGWTGKEVIMFVLPTPKGDDRMIVVKPYKRQEAINADESWDGK